MDIHAPDNLVSLLRGLESRIRALETAPRMTNTSQTGGTFVLVSPNTDENMTLFGSFGSFYGNVIYDGDGSSMVMVRDDQAGLIKPEIPAPFHAPTSTTVTSGAFITGYEWEPRRLYHAVLQVRLAVITDGSTTGEVRVRDTTSGNVTNTLTIPISTNGFAAFDWLHGIGLGDDTGSGCSFRIEVRRASGAGTFTVYPPIRAQMTSLALVSSANSAGNPTVL